MNEIFWTKSTYPVVLGFAAIDPWLPIAFLKFVGFQKLFSSVRFSQASSVCVCDLKQNKVFETKSKSKSYLGVDWTNCVSVMISELLSVSSVFVSVWWVLGEMSCDVSLTRLEQKLFLIIFSSKIFYLLRSRMTLFFFLMFFMLCFCDFWFC